MADDTGAASLRSNGNVLLNGSLAPVASVVFPDDTVETQPQVVAQIELAGSTVNIDPETLIQFERDEIRLEHGSVSVNTTRRFKVRVGCVLVTPVADEWTLYDVTDTNGKVVVAARKLDVNLDSRSTKEQPANRSSNSGRATVQEGHQASREEKCGAGNLKKSPIAAKDGILDSQVVKWTATGLAVAGTFCVIWCSNDDPLSPSKPK